MEAGRPSPCSRKKTGGQCPRMRLVPALSQPHRTPACRRHTQSKHVTNHAKHPRQLGVMSSARGQSRAQPAAVRDGICVYPPLCRGTSQGIYGLRIIGLVCQGETVGKIGEVGQYQVRQGMRHDTWMTLVLGTQRCAILSFAALEPRVFAG